MKEINSFLLRNKAMNSKSNPMISYFRNLNCSGKIVQIVPILQKPWINSTKTTKRQEHEDNQIIIHFNHFYPE